jgi:hypothetical protein
MVQDRNPTPKSAGLGRRRTRGLTGADIAGLIVLGGAGLIVLAQIMGLRLRVPSIEWPAPFASPASQIVLAAGALLGLALLGAAILKAIEHRKVQSWRTVPGRVIRSERGTEIRIGGPVTPEVPVANIAYSYEFDGESFVGTRLTLAERIDPREVDALLRRYPVGAIVSVHVDPDDPSSSVLQRDAPAGLLVGGLATTVALVVSVGALAWFAGEAVRWLTDPEADGILATINAPLLAVFGLLASLFLGIAALIAAPVRQVRRWPITTGRVLSHDIRIKSAGGGTTARAHYPIVRYAYSVRGVEYNGNALSHGSTTGGGRGFAEKVLARYPIGSAVEVRYNPDKPEEAALETHFGLFGWITLSLGLVFVLLGLALGFN